MSTVFDAGYCQYEKRAPQELALGREVAEFLSEFVGTMLFSFFGGLTGLNTSGGAWAALGNGIALAVLVYSTAAVSGGKLNPAVSISLFSLNATPFGVALFKLFFEIGAQISGALAGGALVSAAGRHLCRHLCRRPPPHELRAAAAAAGSRALLPAPPRPPPPPPQPQLPREGLAPFHCSLRPCLESNLTKGTKKLRTHPSPSSSSSQQRVRSSRLRCVRDLRACVRHLCAPRARRPRAPRRAPRRAAPCRVAASGSRGRIAPLARCCCGARRRRGRLLACAAPPHGRQRGSGAVCALGRARSQRATVTTRRAPFLATLPN
jgi:hypothetical protein